MPKQNNQIVFRAVVINKKKSRKIAAKLFERKQGFFFLKELRRFCLFFFCWYNLMGLDFVLEAFRTTLIELAPPKTMGCVHVQTE